jgi:serine/threonine protein kinase
VGDVAFGGDNVPTHGGGTGTLTGSAVESVLKNVLQIRKAERLIGVELDGRYRIEKQIGEGGMGVVFLARHMVIEKAVAIKVLRAEVASDEAVVKRFVQEARAASRIGHPNIIDVTDFGTTKDGLTYQVMEFLEGQTLAALLQQEVTLDLTRALAIVAQMARALGAAHDKGIIHRDLKPENVFLMSREGRDDFVKIVDFGIAKVQPTDANSAEPRLTRIGTVFGTPEYMSPEQASGRNDVDLRADIYALGVILYEMLCGRVPLRGDTTVRTLAMQMLDDPTPIREAYPEVEITAEQESVIMAALAKKRSERYESMSDFLSALEEVTTHTELDLPRVMQMERESGGLKSQHAFDTIPEATLHESAPSATQSKTTPLEIATLAAEQTATRQRRPSRATDPVFIRENRASAMPQYSTLDDEEEDDYVPPSRRSQLWIVAMTILLVGGAASAYILTRGAEKEEEVIAAGEIDAAPLAYVDIADAQVIPEAAGETDAAPVDELIGTVPTHNPSVDPKDKNPKDTIPKDPLVTVKNPKDTFRRTLQVAVHTKPQGATLFRAGTYYGLDGITIERKEGEKLTLSCHLSGYLDGSITIKFDGKREIYLCKLRKIRVKKCVVDTMNPFDDCP